MSFSRPAPCFPVCEGSPRTTLRETLSWFRRSRLRRSYTLRSKRREGRRKEGLGINHGYSRGRFFKRVPKGKSAPVFFSQI